MINLPAGLTRERGLHLLREMLRIRQFEDRCAELYGAGHIRGFLHLYDGEEAIAVGVMQVLGSGDSVVSTYREHGHALARGIGMGPLMAELYGKRTGCSGGRGGSMHIFDAATRFYGGNAIVGGGLPLAVGLALAEKMQGSRSLAACFFDTCTSRGIARSSAAQRTASAATRSSPLFRRAAPAMSRWENRAGCGGTGAPSAG